MSDELKHNLKTELTISDFRTTQEVVGEVYDYTAGCPGCNAALSNKPHRANRKTRCVRKRIEKQMHEDPEDQIGTTKRMTSHHQKKEIQRRFKKVNNLNTQSSDVGKQGTDAGHAIKEHEQAKGELLVRT